MPATMAGALARPHLGCGRGELKPEWPGWHSGATYRKPHAPGLAARGVLVPSRSGSRGGQAREAFVTSGSLVAAAGRLGGTGGIGRAVRSQATSRHTTFGTQRVTVKATFFGTRRQTSSPVADTTDAEGDRFLVCHTRGGRRIAVPLGEVARLERHPRADLERVGQRLCELELIERERRAAERRLKAARFPQTKTLDEFDFGQQPSINKPLVLELAKGQYIDNRENVLLIGSSGVGKTHLAIALGLAACGQGRKVRFFRVTELITLLMEAKEEKQLLRFRKQIKQLDLIVLDELGYVPTGKVGAELLFDVLSTAYARQSLIVTTNLPFEQWTEVLGSERLSGAALDRLTHRCHILEAKGESFRLRDARRRQRRATGPS